MFKPAITFESIKTILPISPFLPFGGIVGWCQNIPKSSRLKLLQNGSPPSRSHVGVSNQGRRKDLVLVYPR